MVKPGKTAVPFESAEALLVPGSPGKGGSFDCLSFPLELFFGLKPELVYICYNIWFDLTEDVTTIYIPWLESGETM